MWLFFSNQITIGSGTYNLFEKYKATEDSITTNLMPMLRLSEAYYIAAESELDPQKGIQWLNEVLAHRGIKEITNSDLLASTLEKEYIREFWGEGQLFYYYKRLKYPEIIDSDDPQWKNTINMEIGDYQPPVPDSESKYTDMFN